MYNNSDFAIVLPNQFATPSEVLQSAANRKERQQQRQDALEEKQREFDQRNQMALEEKARGNRLYNLKQIQEATDRKFAETPNQKISQALGSELSNIGKEAMGYLGEDPAFVKMFIDNKMGNVAKWHDAAVRHAKDIELGVNEFNKTFPNTDLTKTRNATTDMFSNNFLNPDGSLKDPNTIPQNFNYIEPLANPNNLPNFVNSTAPLYKFFTGMPKFQIKGETYKGNKGNVIQKAYEGYTTPYTDEVTGDENKLELRPKSQIAMLDDNGEPIRVADETLRKAMVADPQVEASFLAEWNNEIKNKGLQNVNPHALDILKEAFRYNFAKDQMSAIHQVNFKDKQVIPKAPVTNIYNNKEVRFNDVAKQLDDYLPKEGMGSLTGAPSEAREYLVESVNRGRDIKLDVNKLGVVKANDGTYRVVDMENDGDVVGVFSKTGTNLGTNKGGEKVRGAIIKAGEGQPTQPSMVTVILDGKEGQIPSDKINAFMKKYPNAKRK